MKLRPVKYVIEGTQLTLEYRGETETHQPLWAIIDGQMRYNKETGEFDYEPMPSSRTKEWIDAHSLLFDEAFQIIDQEFETKKS